MTGVAGLAIGAGVRAVGGKAVANAKRDWAAIPVKVKLALLAAALIVAGYFVHQHYVHRALKAADAAGYDRAKAEDAAAVKDARQRAQQAAAGGKAISQETRSKNDEANRIIAADADSLRLRGPGAASCGRVDHPAVPAAGSEPRPAGDRSADAAGSALPSADGQDELAGVPWDWLVGRAQQCDLDRAETLSWRSWYQQQAAAWAKLKSGAATP